MKNAFPHSVRQSLPQSLIHKRNIRAKAVGRGRDNIQVDSNAVNKLQKPLEVVHAKRKAARVQKLISAQNRALILADRHATHSLNHNRRDQVLQAEEKAKETLRRLQRQRMTRMREEQHQDFEAVRKKLRLKLRKIKELEMIEHGLREKLKADKLTPHRVVGHFRFNRVHHLAPHAEWHTPEVQGLRESLQSGLGYPDADIEMSPLHGKLPQPRLHKSLDLLD